MRLFLRLSFPGKFQKLLAVEKQIDGHIPRQHRLKDRRPRPHFNQTPGGVFGAGDIVEPILVKSRQCRRF